MTGFGKKEKERERRKTGFRTSLTSIISAAILLGVAMIPASAAGSLDDDCTQITEDTCLDMSVPDEPLFCDVDTENGHVISGSCRTVVPQDELYDWVVWNTFYPDEVRVGPPFALPVELTNKKPFPVVVTVDYSVPEADVCSVANQGTSQVISSATEITSKMVLLAPRGETLPTGEKDHATMRLRATPEAPGECTFTVSAVVAAAGLDVIPPAEQEVSFQVLPELASDVDLGTYEYNCHLNRFDHDDGPTTGDDVEAGDRSVYYTQSMVEGIGSCKGQSFYTFVDWEYEDEDVERPSNLRSKMAGPVADGRLVDQELDLETGDHEFTIHGIIKEGGFTWECKGAILTYAGQFAAVLAGAVTLYNEALLYALFLALVYGGPIAIAFILIVTAVLAGVIVLTAHYAVNRIIDACSEAVTKVGSSPTIKVHAETESDDVPSEITIPPIEIPPTMAEIVIPPIPGDGDDGVKERCQDLGPPEYSNDVGCASIPDPFDLIDDEITDDPVRYVANHVGANPH